MTTTLNVLFLAAEADPLVKIGGLGDVAGSLPLALRRLSSGQESNSSAPDTRVDVRLALPLYGSIWQQGLPLQRLMEFELLITSGALPVQVYIWERDGLPVYLIDGPFIAPDAPVYTSDTAVDGYKFTAFSLAALELTRRMDWQPHLLHANDWHTAPALYALSLRRKDEPFYAHTAALLGVHNLPYLGNGAGQAMRSLGLPAARGSTLPRWAQDVPLALGLLAADHIVAVSPGYAQEILTPEFGSGLDGYLRQRREDISGILNGIDMQANDPQTDVNLPANYNSDQLAARARNKAALQAELGLAAAADIPLLAIVSRLYTQKGIDLIPEALRLLASTPGHAPYSWQLVILGTGDAALETASQRLEIDFPGRVRVVLRFDPLLSRRIVGGADMLLIPSRYEPCGLTQMVAMRYGCVPLGRATGGLRDTILDYDQSPDSTGFLFDAAEPAALAAALSRALRLYSRKKSWQGLQKRGMQRDFSWTRSACQYLELYLKLVARRQHS